MVNKKRLPVKGKFAGQANRAQSMKEAGERDFESVYGQKTPDAFSMTEDIKAMEKVIVMPDETKNLIGAPVVVPEQTLLALYDDTAPPTGPQVDPMALSAAGFKMPEVNTQMPDIPTTNLGPDNSNPVEEEEKEEKKEDKKPLTPEEKAQELVKFVKSITGHDIPLQTILQWKQMHGDIFMLHLGERVFLFRYLKRQEMLQMKANPKYEELSEDQREEDIYHRCLLYPRVDGLCESADAAGIMGLIANQVKLQSLFLDEMYVAQMVIKI